MPINIIGHLNLYHCFIRKEFSLMHFHYIIDIYNLLGFLRVNYWYKVDVSIYKSVFLASLASWSRLAIAQYKLLIYNILKFSWCFYVSCLEIEFLVFLHKYNNKQKIIIFISVSSLIKSWKFNFKVKIDHDSEHKKGDILFVISIWMKSKIIKWLM